MPPLAKLPQNVAFQFLSSQLNKSSSQSIYVTSEIQPPPGSQSRLIREKCNRVPRPPENIYLILGVTVSISHQLLGVPSLLPTVNAVTLLKSESNLNVLPIIKMPNAHTK